LKSLNLLSSEEIYSISERVDFEIFAGQRIVVTGASGLVGGYLTYALLKCTAFLGEQAPKIIAVSRNGNFPYLQSLTRDDRMTFLKADLETKRMDFDFEILIHAASVASPTQKSSIESIFNINCNLLKNTYTNPGSTQKVLFISTGEVYGSNAPKWVTEDFIGEIDSTTYRANYPKAKLAGEKIVAELSKVGVEGRIARLFHSFGPGLRLDDGRSFADFLWAASARELPELKTSGTQIRSFLYLEDSIVGLLKVLGSDVETPINVGSENEVSILDFAKNASSIAGLKGKVDFNLNETTTTFSPNDVVLPSTSRLRSLGWSQKIDLNKGIGRTIDWIRSLS
jgi:UDP-glucuronate decarboxylase